MMNTIQVLKTATGGHIFFVEGNALFCCELHPEHLPMIALNTESPVYDKAMTGFSAFEDGGILYCLIQTPEEAPVLMQSSDGGLIWEQLGG